MKFAILSLLPLLATASAVGERDADVNSMERVAPNNVAQDAMIGLLGLKSSSEKGQADAAATCPPNYPKYCPAYNFCCPAQAIGCCPLYCCGPGATRCVNGRCAR